MPYLLGPKMFMSCPSDFQKSEVWFTDLWNYSIAPYIIELLRTKLQVSLSRNIKLFETFKY